MEDHPGHVAASDRGGHLERAGGEGGVVMFAEREPREPTGGQVLDDGQVQLALGSGNLALRV